MKAYEELLAELDTDETVVGLVFGAWGWEGFHEPQPPPVPEDKRGIVLTLEEASPMMRSWSFNSDHGAPECYAVRIWTSRRILRVTQYGDGSTRLEATPRDPIAMMPDMPGG